MFLASICKHLITIYDTFSTLSHKIDRFIEKYFGWLPSYHVSRQDMKELIKDLGYDNEDIFPFENAISAESKCYLVLLSPLIIMVIISVLRALYTMIVEKNTLLFMYELVKMTPLIIPFLIVFVWLVPSLFFKYVRIEKKKNGSVYAYGILISVLFPLMVIPQTEYLLNGKPISIEGTLIKKSLYRKNRYLVLQVNINRLHQVKFGGLDEMLVRPAKIGAQYKVSGRISKYYFAWNSIELLGDRQ